MTAKPPSRIPRRSGSLTVQQIEVEIGQDVTFAAAKMAESLHLVENYRQDILPSLRKGLEITQLLFQQGQGGVDVLRVLSASQTSKAEDGYLDALLAYMTRWQIWRRGWRMQAWPWTI